MEQTGGGEEGSVLLDVRVFEVLHTSTPNRLD